MLKVINEQQYPKSSNYKNTIYSRFQRYWKPMFEENNHYSKDTYVSCQCGATDFFENNIAAYVNGFYFLVGYAGMGKTTFLKHFLGYETIAPNILENFCNNNRVLIIPFSWDGVQVNGNKGIDERIKNSIVDACKKAYGKAYSEFSIEEKKQFMEFCDNTISACTRELTIEEEKTNNMTVEEKRIDILCKEHPVEFSSSLLKYVICFSKDKFDKVIFIVDDLEKLSYSATQHIYDVFARRIECFNNIPNIPSDNQHCKYIVIMSMRPHALRYLRDNARWEQENTNAWDYLNDTSNKCIFEAEFPVVDIIKRRLEFAFKSNPPQFQDSWKPSLDSLDMFLDKFDTYELERINRIQALCHFNIRTGLRAVKDILSSYVWCTKREFVNSDNKYPTVSYKDYDFSWVNILRTMSCGNLTVYNSSLNSGYLLPKYDGSDIFICNILIDEEKNLDVLPAIILEFFDFNSTHGNQREQLSERLNGQGYSVTANDLSETLYNELNEYVSLEKIKSTVENLFRNRLLRKNVFSKDSENNIDRLDDDDYLYLSIKGYCLLDLFSDSSALLEIYREDIKRSYDNDDYCIPSYTLIKNNDFSILYEDMIRLCKEIYSNENNYFSHMKDIPFKRKGLNIISKIVHGVQTSLNKQIESLSNYTDGKTLSNIISDIRELKNEIDSRNQELLGS